MCTTKNGCSRRQNSARIRFKLHCLVSALSDVTFVSLRWCERHQSQLRYVIGLSAVLHLLGNVVASCLFLFISRHNYPGGHILWQLHSLESAHAGE